MNGAIRNYKNDIGFGHFGIQPLCYVQYLEQSPSQKGC